MFTRAQRETFLRRTIQRAVHLGYTMASQGLASKQFADLSKKLDCDEDLLRFLLTEENERAKVEL